MTIDEIMVMYVDSHIKEFGIESISTTAEIKSDVKKKFNINMNSVIPTDYCYNRINNGITLKKPTLFEYKSKGCFIYLGTNYRYNGLIYHKPKTSAVEIMIGECVNGKRIITPENDWDVQNLTMTPKSSNPIDSHKTKREPTMQLRFQVLKRDNFKCCACGASPAKEPSVELHIDHIIPWSKGGETVIDNLQTLCCICNYGKSDKL